MRLTGLIAAIAALWGCTSSQTDTQTAQEPPTLLVPPPGTPYGSQLDAIIDKLSGFDAASASATQRAIAACMKESGFQYVAQTYSEPLPTETRRIDDASFRAEFGYGIGLGRGDNAGPNDPNAAIVEAMSASERTRYEEALHGTERGVTPISDQDGVEVGFYYSDSCISIANLDVYGLTTGEQQSLVDQLETSRNELADRMEADPRYQEIWETWSSCMATFGYEVANRFEAVEVVSNEYQNTEPDRAAAFEMNVAAADSDCADRSDVDSRSFALRYSYDQQILEQFQTALSEVTLP